MFKYLDFLHVSFPLGTHTHFSDLLFLKSWSVGTKVGNLAMTDSLVNDFCS